MAARGANGRFAKSAPATEPDPVLSEPFHLSIDPLPAPDPELVPWLAEPEPETPAGAAPAAGDDTDAEIAIIAARGLDELIGQLLGEEYQAAPGKVDKVGEAAAPVIRRALSLFHADQLAESKVPAPVKELVVLAVRAWFAWGDGIVVIAKGEFNRLRAQREDRDGSTTRPAANAGRRLHSDDRRNGHSRPGGESAEALVAAAGGGEAYEAGPAGGGDGAIEELYRRAPRPRRR